MSVLPASKTAARPAIVPAKWLDVETLTTLIAIVASPRLRPAHRIVIFPDQRPPVVARSRKEAQEICALYTVDAIPANAKILTERKDRRP